MPAIVAGESAGERDAVPEVTRGTDAENAEPIGGVTLNAVVIAEVTILDGMKDS